MNIARESVQVRFCQRQMVERSSLIRFAGVKVNERLSICLRDIENLCRIVQKLRSSRAILRAPRLIGASRL